VKGEGRTEDPMRALAWLANLAVERGRPLEAGMVVITGSVIPTVPIAVGERFVFEIEGLGRTELSA
jgi:2-keto-4-pentenoate hydratase